MYGRVEQARLHRRRVNHQRSIRWDLPHLPTTVIPNDEAIVLVYSRNVCGRVRSFVGKAQGH
jgi:hypothetical protein